ncbi:methyl-accepting chemotaxis protein [Clostridiaceae bacterium HSG29]|nr:methyl-accepting chemotaxis protein [Clostridiaceae bacterium HSG29]
MMKENSIIKKIFNGVFTLLLVFALEMIYVYFQIRELSGAGGVVLIIFAGLAIALIIAWVIYKNISKSVENNEKEVLNITKEIALGNFNTAINTNSNNMFNELLKNLKEITSNSKSQETAINKIINGDLDLNIAPKSDKDNMTIQILELREMLSNILDETEKNSIEIMHGDLGSRIDDTKYSNGWEILMNNINNISVSFEKLIKSVPVTLAIFDKEDNVKYVNDFGLNYIGKSLENAKTSKCYELFNTGDCNTDRCGCKIAREQNRVANSETQATINGKVFDVNYSSTALKDTDGKIIGAFEIISDQTEILNNQRVNKKRAKYQDNEVKKLTAGLEQLVKGDLIFEAELAEFDDDTKDIAENFEVLKDKVLVLRDTLSDILSATEKTSNEIMHGNLIDRIDESKYINGWKVLMNNINTISVSFEKLIKSVPVTLAIFDEEDNVKYVNDFGLNLTGKSLGNAKMHKCYELFNTGDCNTDRCGCKIAREQDRVANSSTQANINGEIYDVNYDSGPLKNNDGKIIGAFEIISDQTVIENNRRLLEKRGKYQDNEVSKLVVNLNELLKGNLRLETGIEEFDEDTSEIAKNFKEINDSLGESTTIIAGYVNEISNVLQEIGNGNLNQEVSNDYRGDFAEIKVSLNQILDNLNEAMSEITIAADEVATGSNEVAKSAEDLSQGSTEQASAIEQINSSIINVADQTNKNAENAKDVNKKSNNVIKSAEEGTEKMNEMIDAMDLINKSSKNIGKIISVIDNIAFQTNILALNAAVEAERAGKYGKGFAVVAEEVRNLAGRSANAAKDTTELIEDSIDKIEAGTKTAEQTGVALKEIVTGIKEVSTIIEQIAIASDEQAVAVGEINEGLQQVTDVTQSNTATAEESSAASEEMSSQAEILNERVSTFELRNTKKRTKTTNNKKAKIDLGDDFGKY